MDTKRKLRKWKYRLLKEFGIDPLKCENCGSQMVVNDIYYKKYGSMIDLYYERVRQKIEKEINEIQEIDMIIKKKNKYKVGALFV
jgi:recombinational DNA repair protein (RecF pathway)